VAHTNALAAVPPTLAQLQKKLTHLDLAKNQLKAWQVLLVLYLLSLVFLSIVQSV
jgi:hypothetical protein